MAWRDDTHGQYLGADHPFRRCVFPRNELRTGGAIQAAIIAIVLGLMLKGTPAGADAKWWPYALFGWAAIASVLPWLIGGVDEFEVSLVQSAILAVIFALPMWLATRWLAATPYSGLSRGFFVLLCLWGLHVLIALANTVRWRGVLPRKADAKG